MKKMTGEEFAEIMSENETDEDRCEQLWNRGFCDLGGKVRKTFGLNGIERNVSLEYLAVYDSLCRFEMLTIGEDPIRENFGAFLIKAKYAILHAYEKERDETSKLSFHMAKSPIKFETEGAWAIRSGEEQ